MPVLFIRPILPLSHPSGSFPDFPSLDRLISFFAIISQNILVAIWFLKKGEEGSQGIDGVGSLLLFVTNKRILLTTLSNASKKGKKVRRKEYAAPGGAGYSADPAPYYFSEHRKETHFR
jgi:hypothetical protein